MKNTDCTRIYVYDVSNIPICQCVNNMYIYMYININNMIWIDMVPVFDIDIAGII